MYQIKDFARLPTISHIIWDIDGTITDESGQVNQEVAAKIIRLGLNGVYHSFITGRDAAWVIKKVIEPMKRFFRFPQVVDNLIFFAEVGCIRIKVDSSGNITKEPNPIVEEHPLATNERGIRDDLAELSYHLKNLDDRYKPGREVKPPYEIVYDADGVAWVIDRSKEKTPKCHPYIWSLYKEVFATFEKIRDAQGKYNTKLDQELYAATIIKTIEEAGFGDKIGVEIVSTAINIVPKVKGVKFGKAWAAGEALEYVWQAKLASYPVFETVIDRTIAVGDGKADLEFTTPTFSPEIQEKLKRNTLSMIFVGAETDLPTGGTSEGALRQNIIIRGTGRGNLAFDEPADVIRFERAKGARVVNAVLNFLNDWGYFSSF